MASTRRPDVTPDDDATPDRDAAAGEATPDGAAEAGRTRPEAVHLPVMRDRIVALLAPALERPGSVLVDCTLGLGGHTAAGCFTERLFWILFVCVDERCAFGR